MGNERRVSFSILPNGRWVEPSEHQMSERGSNSRLRDSSPGCPRDGRMLVSLRHVHYATMCRNSGRQLEITRDGIKVGVHGHLKLEHEAFSYYKTANHRRHPGLRSPIQVTSLRSLYAAGHRKQNTVPLVNRALIWVSDSARRLSQTSEPINRQNRMRITNRRNHEIPSSWASNCPIRCKILMAEK